MSIKYAILGFLNWTPLSGYDLKKLFAESAILYWSGNNNQIYRALVELHQENRVTQDVAYQSDKPPRKVYTITDQGRADLRQWLQATPEVTQIRSGLLIQLLWADLLAPAELDELLARYEDELRVYHLMLQEQSRRDQAGQTAVSTPRTPREAYLWAQVTTFWTTSYENELAWIRQLRTNLPTA